jgi:hypothetical protein
VVAGIECMGGRTDIKLAIESFGPEGGLLTLLASLPQGLEKLRPNVKPERILLYTVGGYVSCLAYRADPSPSTGCLVNRLRRQSRMIAPGSSTL